MRLFSTRDRPVHLGPYPLERLARSSAVPDLAALPAMQPLAFEHADALSLVHAMAPYMAMFDLVRDGASNPQRAEVPDDPVERTQHLKAAGYYFDAAMMAVCALPAGALLDEPIRNPRVAALGEALQRSQPKSFAAGMDMILADVIESARCEHGPVAHHGLAPDHEPDLVARQCLVFEQPLGQQVIGHFLHQIVAAARDGHARLQAERWHEAGKRPSRIRMFLIAPARFFQTYVLRFGFLD